MTPVLRIIIIEDNPDDALLVVREVEHAGYAVQAQRVQTAEELRATLAQGTWDLVLADYSLPHFSATEGLAILKETGLDVPFIIVSGCIGEEAAVQLIKNGAAGYVMKDHLSLLGPAVQRELREADERRRKRDAERSLAESEERYRVLVESQTDLIIKTDPKGRFLYANPTYCALFGKNLQELTNSSYEPAIHPDDLSIVADATDRLFHPPYSCRYEARAMTTGGWRWIEWTAHAELDIQGTVVALIGSGRDITDRKQIEEKLRMSELDLQQAQAVAHVGSWRWDIAHDEFVWSDEMCRIFGVAPHTFTGSVQDVIAHAIHPDDRARIEELNRAIIEDHNPQPLEYRIVWPDGSVRTVWVKPGEMTLDDKGHASSLTGVVLDITDRKRAEAEKEATQLHLLESKKLEAVGQLAGGVAHNFNNLLTGILGYIDIARSDLDPLHPARSSLDAARTAALQAAGLARRLLSFGRNAMVLPVVQNANSAVQAALELVCSSLPASIGVIRDLTPDAWDVEVDPSQLTQVLLDLANNAREAMDDRGAITIRTRNVIVDDVYVATARFARTGDFVVISVADTGPGIDPAILPRLFEPFATTKLFGRGMGLATVFGALKQAGGWITAVSTEGVGKTTPLIEQTCSGATFEIYLPRCLEEPRQSLPSPPPLPPRRSPPARLP
jgi:PAS domain S-box-containing protein